MTPDEIADVRADVYAEPWKDPQLFPDLLHKAITELSRIATFTGEDEPIRLGDGFQFFPTPGAKFWASDLLRALQNRARSGIPFGEPAYGDLGPTNPEDL